MENFIHASLQVKAKIVSQDPFDRHGHQKGLNYGHTFGHSLEAISGYKFTHGHAVAIGMKIAGYISNKLGMLNAKELHIHNELLDLAQLNLSLPKSFAVSKYIDHLKKDKVNNGKGVRLVLLKKLGEYSLVGNIDETLIENIIKKHLITS